MKKAGVYGGASHGHLRARKRMGVLLALMLVFLSSVSYADLPSIGHGSSGMTVNGTTQYSGEEGDLTIMIYMVGSNLESDYGCASRDIREIAQSGADFSKVNVVVAAGGASHWQELSIKSGEVGFGTIRRESAQTGIIWDQRVKGSISSESMLTRFLKYAYTNYPAKAYGLIFWNHGGGPLVGFGHDEVANNMLSLKQLSSALYNSPFTAVDSTKTRKKLEWIGFDACLMASYEVAVALEPYTYYLIASEETEPGVGWDYSFVGKPEMAFKGVPTPGKTICDCYAKSMQGFGSPYSLSVIDTIYIGQITHFLNNIFQNKITESLRNGLIRAVYDSRSFGMVSSNSTYDLYDLIGFANNLISRWPFTSDQVQIIRYDVDHTVVYNRTNISGANGMSFYFPLFTDPSRVGAFKVYDNFNLSKEYTSFLRKNRGIAKDSGYTRSITRTYDGKSRLAGLGEAETPAEDKLFVYRMTEEQQESMILANYAVFRRAENGTLDLVRRGSDVEQLYGSLSVRIPCRVDLAGGTEAVTMAERDRSGEQTTWFIPAELTRDGRKWLGSLQYIDRAGEKTVGEFVPYSASDIPPKQLIALEKGDRLVLQAQRYMPAYDEDGAVLPFTEWQLCSANSCSLAEVDGPDTPFIYEADMDPEQYCVQIYGMTADGEWFGSELYPFGGYPEQEDTEGEQ